MKRFWQETHLIARQGEDGMIEIAADVGGETLGRYYSLDGALDDLRSRNEVVCGGFVRDESGKRIGRQLLVTMAPVSLDELTVLQSTEVDMGVKQIERTVAGVRVRVWHDAWTVSCEMEKAGLTQLGVMQYDGEPKAFMRYLAKLRPATLVTLVSDAIVSGMLQGGQRELFDATIAVTYEYLPGFDPVAEAIGTVLTVEDGQSTRFSIDRPAVDGHWVYVTATAYDEKNARGDVSVQSPMKADWHLRPYSMRDGRPLIDAKAVGFARLVSAVVELKGS